MPDKKRCLLSVAMIMKNEEHNLDRALGSIKPYVDEIIVVDTGSTDNSVEVAKKYTDKIYFHEWKDDFSEARNYSLQFPTCEWVLIYDADEEVKEDFAGIREFLANLPEDVNTVYLPTLSYLDWDLKKTEITSTARLFRNGTVRYENIVHNQPIYKGKVVEAPFTIYHYGYIWTRKLKKKKYERTRNLIVKLLEEGKDLSANERIYYLCQLYKTELIGDNKIEASSLAIKILKEIEEAKVSPPIALEVLFIYSLNLTEKGFFNEARNILTMLVNAVEKAPDGYFGLMNVEYNEKNYDKVIEFGEKFFEAIDYVERNPQEFPWTIMSLKYTPVAHAMVCEAALKKSDFQLFSKHITLVFDRTKLTDGEIVKYANAILARMMELRDDDFKNVVKELEFVLSVLAQYQSKPVVNIYDILERVSKFNTSINRSIFQNFMSGDFGRLVMEKILTGKDGLIEYVFGNEVDEWVEKIEHFGLDALLFFYENVPNTEPAKLKALNKLKQSEAQVIKGVAHGLIGDIYLEKANYKLALEYYREAAEILPEISRFVKPILEDLKTKLDPSIDGVFKELKDFYLQNREMMIDSLSAYPRQEIERLYLLSDSDFAKYVSAVFVGQSNRRKAFELFDSIKNWESFPYIEYRYAKLLEESDVQEDLRKAYQYHLRAVNKNPSLGDMRLGGLFRFDNLYPFTVFGNKEDEIVWVGNISEKHSGLGVIAPVRVWKKGERYYYVVPFHVDEAIKVYKQKMKNYKLPILEVKKEEILKVLSELNVRDLRVWEEDEKYEQITKSVTNELAISYLQDSKNVVCFEIVNIAKEFGEVVKNFESGVLFYFVPDFNNHDDIVWYYPIFRFIRTRKQVEDELRKAGAKKIRHFVLNESLRAVIFER